MSRLAVLLALFGVTAGYVARPAMMRPAARVASPLAPLKPALVAPRMGLDPDTVSTPAADETCIEDEAIEECVLAEWPAGQLKVRGSECRRHPPFSTTRRPPRAL